MSCTLPPPSYQEAMAEKLREEIERQRLTPEELVEATGRPREPINMRECKTLIFNDPEISYTAKTDLAIRKMEQREPKKEKELIVFTGTMSSKEMNRRDACVLASMTASLLGISLIPFYCSWTGMRRIKWKVYLTNKGLHYVKKCYKPVFISLEDIQHICLVTEQGISVKITMATGERVRVGCVSNASELVRAVRREKGWCQPRILTE